MASAAGKAERSHGALTSAAAAVARQSYEMRVAMRAATVDVIEERLAIGLEVVDVASALLLGRCCRAVKKEEAVSLGNAFERADVTAAASTLDLERLVEADGEQPATASTSVIIASEIEALPAVPRVLLDSNGKLVTPMPNEYARLEGYRWMHNRERGKGTVFGIVSFGTRGECVLCPSFCTVRPPETSAFIEGDLGGVQFPSNMLEQVLQALLLKARDAPRVTPEDYLSEVERALIIVLVVPSSMLVMKTPPSPTDFGRKASRRHLLHVEAVEMGARLSISVVPAADTPSGNLDKVDADSLYQKLGAQIFAVAGEKGRICFRSHGGPLLDPARVMGNPLSIICMYLQSGWADTLGAMPKTWVRLCVKTRTTSDLEKLVGPPPGSGLFAPVHPSNKTMPQACSYCSAYPVVGFEVLSNPAHTMQRQTIACVEVSPDSMTKPPSVRAICTMCSAFVRGSPAFEHKQILKQYVARPADQIIGTTNEGVDEALCFGLAAGVSQSRFEFRSSMSRLASKSAVVPAAVELHLPYKCGWEDTALPPGAVVLAVSALVSLSCPPDDFDANQLNSCAELECELHDILQCKPGTARIVCSALEGDIGGLLLGIMIVHPATAESLASADDGPQAGTEEVVPLAPLLLYRRLADHLESTLSLDLDLGRHFVASSASRAIVPCSIVFCPAPSTDGSTDDAMVSNDIPNTENLDNVLFGPWGKQDVRQLPHDSPMMEQMPPPILSCSSAESLHASIAVESSTAAMASADIGDWGDVTSGNAAIIGTVLGRTMRELVDSMAMRPTVPMLARSGTWPMVSELAPPSIVPPMVRQVSAPAEVLPMERQVSESAPALTVAPAAIPPVAESSALASHNAVLVVLRSFRPTPYQLALRIRELAAQHLADRCRQLLSRWGGADVDNGISCSMAIIGRDAQQFEGQSALDLAIFSGDRRTMNVLLDFVPGCLDTAWTSESLPPVSEVVKQNLRPHQQVTELEEECRCQASAELRKHIADLLNTPNPVTGHTALYAAAFYPNEHTPGFVERLVKRWSDPNLCGFPNGLMQHGDAEAMKNWESPLVPAVRRGQQSVIRKLLELRSDVNGRTGDGTRILQVGVEQGNRETLAALLACPGCNIDGADLKGRTALVTAIQWGVVELASDLIRGNCDADTRDNNGAAALLHMVKVHDSDLCRLLLQNRADKDAREPSDGSHILHLACQTRNVSLLQELLTARADVHARHPREGKTALHFVAGLHMPSLIMPLLELAAEVDAQSSVGDTPLRAAVGSGDEEVVELLCGARADPNIPNRSGCAPIHAAVTLRKSNLTELLMKFGADVQLADSRRWCPLHYCASSGSVEVVDILIRSRVDLYRRSYNGRTPLDLSQDVAAEALLKEARRDPPPPAMLLPGPQEVAKPGLIKRPRKSCVQSHIAGTASLAAEPIPLSTPAPPQIPTTDWRSHLQARRSRSNHQRGGLNMGSNRSLATPMGSTNESWFPPHSVASREESVHSKSSHLPPIAMGQQIIRHWDTPRGAVHRDGEMALRLVGAGCALPAPGSSRRH